MERIASDGMRTHRLRQRRLCFNVPSAQRWGAVGNRVVIIIVLLLLEWAVSIQISSEKKFHNGSTRTLRNCFSFIIVVVVQMCFSEKQISEHMATHRQNETLAERFALTKQQQNSSMKHHPVDGIGRMRTNLKTELSILRNASHQQATSTDTETTTRHQSHVEDTLLFCETCGKGFDSVDVHTAHMRTHNISKGIRVVYTVRSVC